MLDDNGVYIARTLLKNQILESDAQTFEALFTRIMQKSNNGFIQVRPYGNLGDKKNDGFDKTTGTYYQVYSPEDISNANTIPKAIKKLNDDFEGLYSYWNPLYQIRQFYYVINDRYKGVPPQLPAAVASLEQKYPEITFGFYLSNALEDTFVSLSDSDMISIVGCIPNPAEQLDYSALTDVLNYLMNMTVDDSGISSFIVPDYDEKIKINHLSEAIGCQLKTANYQVGGLESFFRKNSHYTKDQIQQKIIKSYVDITNSIDNSIDNYSDIVFVKLVDSIYPNGTAAIRNAVIILISYFFETCDIFESPTPEVSV